MLPAGCRPLAPCRACRTVSVQPWPDSSRHAPPQLPLHTLAASTSLHGCNAFEDQQGCNAYHHAQLQKLHSHVHPVTASMALLSCALRIDIF